MSRGCSMSKASVDQLARACLHFNAMLIFKKMSLLAVMFSLNDPLYFIAKFFGFFPTIFPNENNKIHRNKNQFISKKYFSILFVEIYIFSRKQI